MADGKIIIETGLDTQGVETGLKKLSNLVKTGLGAATAAVGATAAAITGAGAAAIAVGSNFEEGMSKASAISGASGKELQDLTDKAKEMGAKTKFSATEAASAFEYMAMAGWKTGDMLDGIEGIMNLAAASGEDLATTSDIVTDALTAFGLKASDSAHFSDVLAKAASSSNTNVGMMGATFKYVAPLAGAMKYSIEDTAVAIGLMANAGIKGEQAGTSLRAMLTRLTDPPKDAAEAMESLGISITNADGSMKPLSEVISILREKFSGLTDSQKAAFASSIAGQEAMSGLLAIVGASDEDFQSLTEAINNADGAAEQMAETMQDNLKGKITILQSSLEGLGIEIYESMEEPLKGAAERGIDAVNDITKAFKQGGLKSAVKTAGNLFANFATDIAKQAPKMINSAVALIKAFVDGIIRNKDQLLGAAGEIAMSLSDGLIQLLPAQMQAPVKSAVDAIAESFQSGGLRTAIDMVARLFSNLINVISNMAEAVLPVLTTAVDFLAEHMDLVIPILAGVAAGMVALNAASAAATAITGIKTAIEGITIAMAANPFTLIIAGLSALMVATGAYVMSTQDAQSGTEKLADAYENLGESVGGIGSHIVDFVDGIDTAESHLSAFDDTLFASSEEQQELQRNMDEVQAGITTICKTASDERRDYTAEEIAQLDNYFDRLNELNEQQFAIEQAKMQAIRQQAETAAAARDGDLEKYKQNAQEWIKTTEDQVEQEKSLIENQTIQEIALLNQRYGDKANTRNAAYMTEYNEIMAKKERNLEAVNSEVSEISQAYMDGYLAQSDALAQFNSSIVTANQDVEKENQRHSQALIDLQADCNRQITELGYDQMAVQNGQKVQTERLEKEHAENLADIWNGTTANLTAEQQEQLGTFISMAIQTREAGGELEGAALEAANNFVSGFESMPPEAQEAMANTLAPMLEQMSDSIPEFEGIAEKDAQAVIDTLKNTLGVHSPSTITTEIGKNTTQGFKNGLEQGGEETVDAASQIGVKALEALTKSALNGAADKAGAGMTSAFNKGIVSGSGEVGRSGKNVATSAKTGLGSVKVDAQGTTMGNQFSLALNNMQGIAKTAALNVVQGAKASLGSVESTTTGSSFGQQYVSGINGKSSAAKAVASNVAQGAKSSLQAVNGTNTGNSFAQQYITGISNGNYSSKNAGTNLAQNAKNAANNVNASSSGTHFTSTFSSGITSNARAAINAGNNVANHAKNAVSGVSAYNAGYNFVSGFASGISANIFAATAQAAAMASAALNAAKSRLGIHSPSTVARKEVGKQYGAGVELGILDKVKDVDKAGKKLSSVALSQIDVSAMAAKMRGAVNAQKATLTSSISAPVISKVYQQISAEQEERPIIIKGEIHTHVDMDSRELGIAITPIVSEELAWLNK